MTALDGYCCTRGSVDNFYVSKTVIEFLQIYHPAPFSGIFYFKELSAFTNNNTAAGNLNGCTVERLLVCRFNYIPGMGLNRIYG